MKMVFEKFESRFPLKRTALNVVRIEDRSLYARCALSLSQCFPEECLEPAFFFNEEGREVKADKLLLFLGDPIHLDLNDKRIIGQALKVVLNRVIEKPGMLQHLEALQYETQDLFAEEFMQMFADYSLTSVLDIPKELKLLGFGIDESDSRTVSERLMHALRIMADLFADKVICFINLRSYLSDEQYNEFCKLAIALQLCVLSYEQGFGAEFGNLENGLYIDVNYLEE